MIANSFLVGSILHVLDLLTHWVQVLMTTRVLCTRLSMLDAVTKKHYSHYSRRANIFLDVLYNV